MENTLTVIYVYKYDYDLSEDAWDFVINKTIDWTLSASCIVYDQAN